MVFVEFQGWINTTVMFYAGYPASKLVSDAGIEYNLPLAYLLVGCSYFVCSLVMVVRRSVTLRSLLMILFFEATVYLPCLITPRATRCGVFLTYFQQVFGSSVKHCLECLIKFSVETKTKEKSKK